MKGKHMQMNDKTKEALQAKLGALMFANAELGATNDMLVDLVHRQKAEIDQLKAQLENKAEGEGVDANGAGVALPANGEARH